MIAAGICGTEPIREEMKKVVSMNLHQDEKLGAHMLAGGGVRFAVWAPDRESVRLIWDDRETPLSRQDDGVWAATLEQAGPGIRYEYKLDNDGPFPDPYARSLPEGVHGRSEVVDPRAFAWTDATWRGLTRDHLVIYEIHVGTFTAEGTFDGVIGQLEELAGLGVTAIELMPISSFPGNRNWGYDGVGHYAPDADYGGPEGLRRLVDAAHAAGIGVILDVVYNHLGPDGNYLRAYAADYFTDRHATPWGEALNYDGRGSQFVREWAIGNAIQWIDEYHIDGLRLDATAEIHDDSADHLLAELARRTRAATTRGIVLIAEDNRNDAKLVRSPVHGGYGLDAIWADDFHHAIRTLLTDANEGYYRDYSGAIVEVVRTIQHGLLYRGQMSINRKAPRGKPTGRAPAEAFIYCIENHDQVGNRAQGERLSHLTSAESYRAASGLLLLVPETPLIFMGQEFASSSPFLYFTDHHEELGRLVTEGRRSEFAHFSSFASETAKVPDPQAVGSYQRSKLNFDERQTNAGVYALYREFLALRRKDTVLSRANRDNVRATIVNRTTATIVLHLGASWRLIVVHFGNEAEVELPEVNNAPWNPLISTNDTSFGGSGREAMARQGRIGMSGPGVVLLGIR